METHDASQVLSTSPRQTEGIYASSSRPVAIILDAPENPDTNQGLTHSPKIKSEEIFESTEPQSSPSSLFEDVDVDVDENPSPPRAAYLNEASLWLHERNSSFSGHNGQRNGPGILSEKRTKLTDPLRESNQVTESYFECLTATPSLVRSSNSSVISHAGADFSSAGDFIFAQTGVASLRARSRSVLDSLTVFGKDNVPVTRKIGDLPGIQQDSVDSVPTPSSPLPALDPPFTYSRTQDEYSFDDWSEEFRVTEPVSSSAGSPFRIKIEDCWHDSDAQSPLGYLAGNLPAVVSQSIEDEVSGRVAHQTAGFDLKETEVEMVDIAQEPEETNDPHHMCLEQVDNHCSPQSLDGGEESRTGASTLRNNDHNGDRNDQTTESLPDQSQRNSSAPIPFVEAVQDRGSERPIQGVKRKYDGNRPKSSLREVLNFGVKSGIYNRARPQGLQLRDQHPQIQEHEASNSRAGHNTESPPSLSQAATLQATMSQPHIAQQLHPAPPLQRDSPLDLAFAELLELPEVTRFLGIIKAATTAHEPNVLFTKQLDALVKKFHSDKIFHKAVLAYTASNLDEFKKRVNNNRTPSSTSQTSALPSKLERQLKALQSKYEDLVAQHQAIRREKDYFKSIARRVPVAPPTMGLNWACVETGCGQVNSEQFTRQSMATPGRPEKRLFCAACGCRRPTSSRSFQWSDSTNGHSHLVPNSVPPRQPSPPPAASPAKRPAFAVSWQPPFSGGPLGASVSEATTPVVAPASDWQPPSQPPVSDRLMEELFGPDEANSSTATLTQVTSSRLTLPVSRASARPQPSLARPQAPVAMTHPATSKGFVPQKCAGPSQSTYRVAKAPLREARLPSTETQAAKLTRQLHHHHHHEKPTMAGSRAIAEVNAAVNRELGGRRKSWQPAVEIPALPLKERVLVDLSMEDDDDAPADSALDDDDDGGFAAEMEAELLAGMEF